MIERTKLISAVHRLSLVTLRELTMLDIMNALTDKVGWEHKASFNLNYPEI